MRLFVFIHVVDESVQVGLSESLELIFEIFVRTMFFVVQELMAFETLNVSCHAECIQKLFHYFYLIVCFGFYSFFLIFTHESS